MDIERMAFKLSHEINATSRPDEILGATIDIVDAALKIKSALQAVRDDALDEAIYLCRNFPSRQHGNLSSDPVNASDQTAYEIGRSIRYLKERNTK